MNQKYSINQNIWFNNKEGLPQKGRITDAYEKIGQNTVSYFEYVTCPHEANNDNSTTLHHITLPEYMIFRFKSHAMRDAKMTQSGKPNRKTMWKLTSAMPHIKSLENFNQAKTLSQDMSDVKSDIDTGHIVFELNSDNKQQTN